MPPATSAPSACTGPSGGSTTDVEASSIPAPLGLRHERICGPPPQGGALSATELVRRFCPAADGWTGAAPPGSSAGWPAAPVSPNRSRLTRCGTRSSPPPRRRGHAPGHAGSRLARRPARGDALRPCPASVSRYPSGPGRLGQPPAAPRSQPPNIRGSLPGLRQPPAHARPSHHRPQPGSAAPGRSVCSECTEA